MILQPNQVMEQDRDLHVYPEFGRPHVMSQFCWCEPEEDGEYSAVYIHHQDH
jgi:hypothetical protein